MATVKQEWIELTRRIEMSEDIGQLRGLRSELHHSFDAFPISEKVELAHCTLNDLHDAILRKAAVIAERDIGWLDSETGRSIAYALLLLGSGGRREQTLSSDQDNAIVYEINDSSVSVEEAHRGISKLAHAIRARLEQVGYPPCEGNVLITNPIWRRTSGEWGRSFAQWEELSTFETVRNLLIAADARPIYGNPETSGRFTHAFASAIRINQEALMPRMLTNTLRHKVLLGPFGNWLTEPYGTDKGSIDIKYGAYLPMVNAIRLLALHEQIDATSTLERIVKLERSGAISSVTAGDYQSAFRTVLALRLMVPTFMDDDNGFYGNRGKLTADRLTKPVKKELKEALRIGFELQRCVRRKFSQERRL
jgi:CBS domain-containing protein